MLCTNTRGRKEERKRVDRMGGVSGDRLMAFWVMIGILWRFRFPPPTLLFLPLGFGALGFCLWRDGFDVFFFFFFFSPGSMALRARR